MAEKRMFTKKITESDAFLEMPLSAQCLYFHLNMEADDDGFVNHPKKTMRTIGANEDDIKLLITKRFVLVFDSGVIVIKHWRMHNTIQNDRYHPTDYQEEFKQLALKDNKSYTKNDSGNILETDWKQNGNSLETEISIGLDKNRLDKNSVLNNTYTSFAPQSDDSDADGRVIFEEMPCLKGEKYIIYTDMIEEYKKDFPALDVEQEIRNAVAWVKANSKNMKTKNGAKRYLTAWLIRAQNKARAYSEKNRSGVNYVDI